MAMENKYFAPLEPIKYTTEMFTPKEAAKILNVTERQICLMIERGDNKLKYIRIRKKDGKRCKKGEGIFRVALPEDEVRRYKMRLEDEAYWDNWEDEEPDYKKAREQNNE